MGETCQCPICVSNRALKDLSAALDTFVEYGESDQMDLEHLRDEANEVLDMPWWRPFAARKRLRQALVAVNHAPRPWVNWKTAAAPAREATEGARSDG